MSHNSLTGNNSLPNLRRVQANWNTRHADANWAQWNSASSLDAITLVKAPISSGTYRFRIKSAAFRSAKWAIRYGPYPPLHMAIGELVRWLPSEMSRYCLLGEWEQSVWCQTLHGTQLASAYPCNRNSVVRMARKALRQCVSNGFQWNDFIDKNWMSAICQSNEPLNVNFTWRSVTLDKISPGW